MKRSILIFSSFSLPLWFQVPSKVMLCDIVFIFVLLVSPWDLMHHRQSHHIHVQYDCFGCCWHCRIFCPAPASFYSQFLLWVVSSVRRWDRWFCTFHTKLMCAIHELMNMKNEKCFYMFRTKRQTINKNIWGMRDSCIKRNAN